MGLCVWSGKEESKGVHVSLQPSFMVQAANFLCNYNKSQRQTHRMVLSLYNYSINCPIFSPRRPPSPFSLLEHVVILNTIRQMHLKNLLCKQRVKRGSLLLFPSHGCLLQGDLQSKGNNLTAQEIERELQDLRESRAEKPINTEPSCQGSGGRGHGQAGPCSSFTPPFLPLGCCLEVPPALPGINSRDEF